MAHQAELFDGLPSSVPEGLPCESWMKDPPMVEAIAAGAVCCAACRTVLDFGDVDAYPVEVDADGALHCMRCAAQRLGFRRTECDGCSKTLYVDPSWALSYAEDNLPDFLKLRIVVVHEVYMNPWDDGSTVPFHFCYDCASGAAFECSDTAYCEGCGRLFFADPRCGRYLSSGWYCHKCWVDKVLEEGFSDDEVVDEQVLRDDDADEEDLKAAGYHKVVEIAATYSETPDAYKRLLALAKAAGGVPWLIREADDPRGPFYRQQLQLWVKAPHPPELEKLVAVAMALDG